MITIARLLDLQREAFALKVDPNPNYPPSVYYRYTALVVKELSAKVFVELGCCGGGCSRTVAMHNPATKVVTIDNDKLPQVSPIEVLCPNFEFRLGDSIGLSEEIGNLYKPIDVLFIDTTHEYEQTMGEYNAWLPYMKDGGVILFDDLYRDGTTKAWHEISGTKTAYDGLHVMHDNSGFGALIVKK
jgi:predicted O-methyltransferase YrrM